MKDVSHANPYTGKTAGQLFSRGPIVAADGGEENAVDPDAMAADEESETTMRAVSHTPPNGGEGVNRAFERGQRDSANATTDVGEHQ